MTPEEYRDAQLAWMKLVRPRHGQQFKVLVEPIFPDWWQWRQSEPVPGQILTYAYNSTGMGQYARSAFIMLRGVDRAGSYKAYVLPFYCLIKVDGRLKENRK